MFSIKDISEYIVALIAAFASHYSMTEVEAYRYLNRYGYQSGSRLLRRDAYSIV